MERSGIRAGKRVPVAAVMEEQNMKFAALALGTANEICKRFWTPAM